MHKKVIRTDQAPGAIGPYSQAILAGHTLYCSGQIALEPSTGVLIMGSIAEETEQVMKHIWEFLAAADMGFENIVKCSIFMSSMEHYTTVNEVYLSYFSDPLPAREAVAVKSLPRNVNVEISVIAVKI